MHSTASASAAPSFHLERSSVAPPRPLLAEAEIHRGDVAWRDGLTEDYMHRLVFRIMVLRISKCLDFQNRAPISGTETYADLCIFWAMICRAFGGPVLRMSRRLDFHANILETSRCV